jgi:phosphopantothenoylcysteine decarboxylase/phosphopantothenate--cysteine ligase
MPDTFHVLLGVCGGVAAYKAADLARELQRNGADVRVVMTRSAQQFIQPLTFASLTGSRVFGDLWESPNDAAVIEHIAQAQWADVVLVAPATANTIARLAYGLADDFLSAACLATKAPMVFAPAMNVNMWQNAATQANIATLQQRGHTLVPPESGYLACGMNGDGRLAEIDTIVRHVLERMHPKLDMVGETVLITAGGTREPIDPVRFLGNRSSGRMGYALAAASQRRGARVVLVSTAANLPTPPHCERISVNTALEMHTAVLDYLPQATIVIKAAAVADFRVTSIATAKLHRDTPLTLELEPTEDIVRSVVEHRQADTLVIAFAAEMGLDIERAREKLRRKGADAIVLNDISQPGLGFDAERNSAIFITDQAAVNFAENTKAHIADQILDHVVHLRLAHPGKLQNA